MVHLCCGKGFLAAVQQAARTINVQARLFEKGKYSWYTVPIDKILSVKMRGHGSQWFHI